jgi:hypothetical protein
MVVWIPAGAEAPIFAALFGPAKAVPLLQSLFLKEALAISG